MLLMILRRGNANMQGPFPAGYVRRFVCEAIFENDGAVMDELASYVEPRTSPELELRRNAKQYLVYAAQTGRAEILGRITDIVGQTMLSSQQLLPAWETMMRLAIDNDHIQVLRLLVSKCDDRADRFLGGVFSSMICDKSNPYILNLDVVARANIGTLDAILPRIHLHERHLGHLIWRSFNDGKPQLSRWLFTLYQQKGYNTDQGS